MAYLESIYGGLKLLRDAANDRNKALGVESFLSIFAADGFIVVSGISAAELSTAQKKKLDAAGWTYQSVPPEEKGLTVYGEWKRSC